MQIEIGQVQGHQWRQPCTKALHRLVDQYTDPMSRPVLTPMSCLPCIVLGWITLSRSLPHLKSSCVRCVFMLDLMLMPEPQLSLPAVLSINPCLTISYPWHDQIRSRHHPFVSQQPAALALFGRGGSNICLLRPSNCEYSRYAGPCS